ncbi:MAG: hypothetical protein WCF17_02915, partial [Terracidiphilus sp.]
MKTRITMKTAHPIRHAASGSVATGTAGLLTGCRAGLPTRTISSLGRMTIIRITALSGLLALAGCNVGPKYHAPTPPQVTAPNYKESTVNFQDQPGWKVASPQEAMIRGNWWEIFHEPELNALEEQLN